jgi:ligand-binding sensor domain-containing protein
VSKYNGTNWTTYNTSNSGLVSAVYYIDIDHAGNKWFGTYDGGVSKYDGTNWTTYNTSNSGLASNQVWALAIDSAGNK